MKQQFGLLFLIAILLGCAWYAGAQIVSNGNSSSGGGGGGGTPTVQATNGIIGNGSSASPLALSTPIAAGFLPTTRTINATAIGSNVFNGTETSQVITSPTGTTSSMQEVATFFWTTSPGTITPPAGWSLACSAVNGTGLLNAYTATGATAGTFSWVNSIATQGGVVSLAGVSGLDTGFGTSGCVTSASGSAGTTFSATGGTGATATDLVFSVAGDSAGGTPGPQSSPPAGIVLGYINPTHGTTGVAYLPGSTTVPSMPWTSASSGNWTGDQLAFTASATAIAAVPNTSLIANSAVTTSLTASGSQCTFFNSLPACNGTTAGLRGCVVDGPSACGTFNTNLSAGGAVICPAFCNGANWVSN